MPGLPPIEVPIGAMFPDPPVELLGRVVIPGLFSGSGNLPNPAGLPRVLAYGLSWSFFTVPAGFGRTPGTPIVYQPRMLQLSTFHDDLHGNSLLTEYHGFQVEDILWRWENKLPSYVHYEIAPGVQVVFYWLLVA